MGLAARRAREKREVRHKIIDATRKLFATCGFEGVTMRKIAAMIEYSPTVIYSHFGDKQTLIDDLIEQDYLALGEKLQDIGEHHDPILRLRLIAERFAEFGVENPNHYRVLVMTARPVSRNGEQCLVRKGDVTQDAYALAFNTVREAMKQNLLRADLADADLITQTVIAGVHGIISMHIAIPNDQWVQWRPVQARVRLMIDALIRGLISTTSEHITARPALAWVSNS